jgi:3-dehydroquinate synthase
MRRLELAVGGGSTPIVVGDRVIDQAGGLLAGAGFDTPPVVVSNPRVLALHGDRLRRSLEARFGPVAVVEIGDGERFKNQATLERIYRGLFRARADRRSWILALGGGVVGDVAGFAAATFMRGIRYASIPTTLLAQVDSSIGGKVGINVPQGKNLIGAFHQPSAVLSDIAVLRTLPARELASGLFEVVKSGAIRSLSLVAYLEKNLDAVRAAEPRALERIVWDAVRIKAEIVGSDERESGARMLLNYGHTVGHALEAATGYRRFTHGEAVGWGMIAALGFGRQLGFLRAEEAARLADLIRRVAPLPTLAGIPARAVWSALGRDKKFSGGRMRMILLPRLGQSEVRADIDPARLRGFVGRFLASGGEDGLR